MMSLPSHASSRLVTFTAGPMVMLTGLSEVERKAIKARLTIPNPRKAIHERFSRYAKFDGPSHLVGYEETATGQLLVAPGAAAMVWHLLEREGVDRTFAPGSIFTGDSIGLDYKGKERSYQVQALMGLLNHRQGLIVGPCGSGKTHMAMRAMAHRDVPALVLVHTGDLVDQWAADIAEWTNLKAEVYRGRSKKCNINAPIVIATVQALRQNPAALRELAGTRGQVFVDECHHQPADMFCDVLRQLDPAYRYGFTATPDRADGTTNLMYWWIGPERARVEREDLEDAGVIMRPRVELLVTSFRCSYGVRAGDDAVLTRKLCEDVIRRRQISDAIASRVKSEGGLHLVLTKLIAYGYDIFEDLEMVGIRCAFLHGTKTRAERLAIRAEVDAGNIHVLIATSLADEGLDMPNLTHGWGVTPTRSQSKIEQRVGRIARSHPGKSQPVWVDVVDPEVSRFDQDTGKTHRIFLNQFRSRLITYRRIADVDERAVQALFKGHR